MRITGAALSGFFRKMRPNMLINGIDIEVRRKRIKNLHIYVKPPEGAVLVTVPFRTSDAAVRRFVSEREAWIEKSRQKVKREAFEREQRRQSIYLPDGTSIMDDGSLKTEDISRLLRERIAKRLPLWEEQTGLKAKSIQIRSMKTRWGSCTVKTGAIRINLLLAYYPEECLDYILLHELLHIRIADHGPRFKAELDRYMPDWRERRKMLRS